MKKIIKEYSELPKRHSRINPTGLATKYWVAIDDYSDRLTNYSQFVDQSLNLKSAGKNAVPSSTIDKNLAVKLAKRAIAKWPDKYVFVGQDKSSHGMQTGLNHLRASTLYIWSPKYKMWNDIVDEAMPIDDILKRGEQRKADREREEADELARRQSTSIKSIWVKGFKNISRSERVAELEITYATGEKEQTQFNVTTDIEDKYYKKVAQGLRATAGGHRVTPDDIALSMVRINFGNSAIQWYYGPQKTTGNKWWLNNKIDTVGKKVRSGSFSSQSSNDQSGVTDYYNGRYNSGNVRIKYDPSVVRS